MAPVSKAFSSEPESSRLPAGPGPAVLPRRRAWASPEAEGGRAEAAQVRAGEAGPPRGTLSKEEALRGQRAARALGSCRCCSRDAHPAPHPPSSAPSGCAGRSGSRAGRSRPGRESRSQLPGWAGEAPAPAAPVRGARASCLGARCATSGGGTFGGRLGPPQPLAEPLPPALPLCPRPCAGLRARHPLAFSAKTS